MADYPLYPLYVLIARAQGSLERCRSGYATDSQQTLAPRWKSRIDALAKYLPHGSGFDTTAVIETDDIKPNVIRIRGSFHNMNSDGYYCGWRDFNITIKPDLESGFTLRVVCGDSELRDHIEESYYYALNKLCSPSVIYRESEA